MISSQDVEAEGWIRIPASKANRHGCLPWFRSCAAVNGEATKMDILTLAYRPK